MESGMLQTEMIFVEFYNVTMSRCGVILWTPWCYAVTLWCVLRSRPSRLEACDVVEGGDRRNVTVYVIDSQRYACRCDIVIFYPREFDIRLIYLQTF